MEVKGGGIGKDFFVANTVDENQQVKATQCQNNALDSYSLLMLSEIVSC